MRITTWAEYGVICALNLAKRTDLGPVNGREIARQERLPADYVEQILLRLGRAGRVRSSAAASRDFHQGRDPRLGARDVRSPLRESSSRRGALFRVAQLQ